MAEVEDSMEVGVFMADFEGDFMEDFEEVSGVGSIHIIGGIGDGPTMDMDTDMVTMDMGGPTIHQD
jgi:hypothetical protein